MKTSCVITVLLLTALVSSQSEKGWRGIVPLHSTRSDVERLAGKPEQSADEKATYRTVDGLVQVEYATAPCKGGLLGWNVPAGTVLQVNIAPQKAEHFTPDESKYIKAYGHTARDTYINIEGGVKYEVLPDNSIYLVSYVPSKSDGDVRCPGFPPFDGGMTQYRPYDTYGNIPRSDEEARLDNFASALCNGTDSNAYIVTYDGKSGRSTEAKTHAEHAREYLINRRGIAQQRVIVIYGGRREKFETELYLVPGDMPAPTPAPTIPSNEVQRAVLQELLLRL